MPAAAATALKVNGTFVAEKISRVRWIPEQYTAPSCFLTGSWDSAHHAAIKLWRLTADNDFLDAEADNLDDGSASQSTAGAGSNSLLVPRCHSRLPLAGDCTGMEWIDSEHLIVTSADGSASVLQLNRAEQLLRERQHHRQLHRFADGTAAPVTGVAVHERAAVTVGEDGCLNLLHTGHEQVVRRFANADSVTLTAVAFIGANEVFTGNRNGMIKQFDVREHVEMDTDRSKKPSTSSAPEPATRPVATMLISCDDEKKPNGVTAIAFHPTQRHILLAGSEEGSITVWDLRQMREAASYLTAHDSAIAELRFHPTAPNRLFSAAEGGELFEWSHVHGGVAAARVGGHGHVEAVAEGAADQLANPWLSGERIKNKISWTPLISGLRRSINTFDAAGPSLICGSDNEAVYLVENLY